MKTMGKIKTLLDQVTFVFQINSFQYFVFQVPGNTACILLNAIVFYTILSSYLGLIHIYSTSKEIGKHNSARKTPRKDHLQTLMEEFQKLT